MRGRRRIFVTQADRQKAYRERKRRAGALRNSPEIVTPDSISEIDRSKNEVDRLAQECEANREAFYQICVIENNYALWHKRAIDLQEQWWAAHQVWWHAKLQQKTGGAL